LLILVFASYGLSIGPVTFSIVAEVSGQHPEDSLFIGTAFLYQLIDIHHTSCSWIAAATLTSFCIDRQHTEYK
jgi:hypothetical protein